jgi:hypothetical protein
MKLTQASTFEAAIGAWMWFAGHFRFWPFSHFGRRLT